jgi:hypothetical protein
MRMASALLALTLVGSACQKENANGPGPIGLENMQKARQAVNRLAAISGPINEPLGTILTVTTPLNANYGTLDGTMLLDVTLVEQSSTRLLYRGTSPGSTPPNATACDLRRGVNATTGGPQYVIRPTGVGRVLMVQIKGGGLLPSGHTWFTYDTALDSWTADPLASTYFIWAVALPG